MVYCNSVANSLALDPRNKAENFEEIYLKYSKIIKRWENISYDKRAKKLSLLSVTWTFTHVKAENKYMVGFLIKQPIAQQKCDKVLKTPSRQI